MKNVIKPLDKSVLIPSVLTAAASPADQEHLKNHNRMQYAATQIISNGEMEDIIKNSQIS